MKYNLLGSTGLRVSELCMGTMTFGSGGEMWDAIGTQEQEEANNVLETAVDHGVNFVDTANIYSYGQAEQILGNALNKADIDREELVIASKVRGEMGEGPNQGGLSRYHVIQAVDDSLDRLNLHHLDVLYVHGFDSDVPIEETMRTLNHLVATERTQYLGVSNWPAWAVIKANEIARSNNWHTFQVGQYYYSLAGRDIERHIIPALQDQDMGLAPWSPLAGGYMTGKYTDADGSDGRRANFDFPPVDEDQADEIVRALQQMAASRDATVAQLALAWIRHQQPVTSTIIGAKTMDQLTDNLASTTISFTEDELERLDELSSLTKEYPGWMLDMQDS